jgi:hypothetical protein
MVLLVVSCILRLVSRFLHLVACMLCAESCVSRLASCAMCCVSRLASCAMCCVVCCVLCVVWCALRDVVLHDVCCVLCVACCVRVACCVLRVACCALCVARCVMLTCRAQVAYVVRSKHMCTSDVVTQLAQLLVSSKLCDDTSMLQLVSVRL